MTMPRRLPLRLGPPAPEPTFRKDLAAQSTTLEHARPAARIRPLHASVPDALPAPGAPGRVHAELRAASPEETTVTDVAGRWGFVHHSHSAAVCRARYGHNPAQTLRA
jgi:AraC-like DNA-binding protein